MKKDNIDKLFDNIDFDLENPRSNHSQRFLDKLSKQNHTDSLALPLKKEISWRKTLISIAASIILISTLFIGFQKNKEIRDLSHVSPKMAKTQEFFTISITEEMSKLQNESLPEAQIIIKDAIKQIKILEVNYESLKQDLTESGDDNRVIYAMISNFQNRINILHSTLEKINNVKKIKHSSNETSKSI